MGRKRKHRPLAAACDAYFEVTFADLDAALDEVNTLIDVESALQTATGGLLYLAWDQSFTGPGG